MKMSQYAHTNTAASDSYFADEIKNKKLPLHLCPTRTSCPCQVHFNTSYIISVYLKDSLFFEFYF